MRYYYVFNGRDSRDIGVYIESAPVFMRPKERVNSITVPGRAGTLTIREIVEADAESYETYMQALSVNVHEDKVREFLSIMRGEGWLTISNDPHKRQMARVINNFDLKRLHKALPWYHCTLAFTCQPYKYDTAETVETYEDGDYIHNNGDAVERPEITIYGNGTLGVNDLVIENVTGGCIIDCDAREVLTLDRTELLTASSAGKFPAIPIGQSNIWLTGAESCRIKRAVRYL